MPRLEAVIEERKDEILKTMVEAIRLRLPRERAFTEEQLIDSLHLFLSEVVVALRSETPNPSYMAEAHGGQRHVLGANVGEVVFEYALLFEIVAKEAPQATQAELTRLSMFLFGAASDAARVFTAEHDAALRKHAWEHFAFVAHEIRNPLHSARLACEMLKRAPAPAAVEALDRNIRQLVGVVDQALLEARIAGLKEGVAVLPQTIRLDRLCAEAAADAEMDASARGIQLVVDDKQLEALADPRLLRSALGNLVRNAVKFSRDGATVRIRLARENRFVQIHVDDECGGLPPDKAEDLFAAFYQAGKDRTGFGLGLAIARQAVEAHGGTIRVKDEPGKGCTFTIELPT